MLRRFGDDDYAISDRGRQRPKTVLVRSGPVWTGFGLEVWESGGESMPEIVLPFDVIAINEGIQTSEVRWTGQRPVSGRSATGMVALLPGGVPYSARAWAPARCTAIGLQREMFESFVGVDPPCGFELSPRYGVTDDFLQATCSALVADARDGHPMGGLYGETLASALVAHILRHHSNRGFKSAALPDPGHLRVELIRQFIHDRLEEKVSLAAMATSLQMDMYVFARWFKKAFGMPPHQYVLAARVERAKGLLRGTNEALVTIAMKCGFSSQSHFGSVFHRAVGVSPGEYRLDSGSR